MLLNTNRIIMPKMGAVSLARIGRGIDNHMVRSKVMGLNKDLTQFNKAVATMDVKAAKSYLNKAAYNIGKLTGDASYGRENVTTSRLEGLRVRRKETIARNQLMSALNRGDTKMMSTLMGRYRQALVPVVNHLVKK